MFEKDLPGHNTTGFAPEQKVSDLPKETCETINNSWGFNLKDNQHKSEKALIQYLVKACGYGANFLLNVGPMPNGNIQPEHQAPLNKVGDWVNVHGATIYGTEGGPLTPRDWGVTTQNGKTVYVHVLQWQDESLLIPSWGQKIASAKIFGGQPLKFSENAFGISINIPKNLRSDIDTIVELTIK